MKDTTQASAQIQSMNLPPAKREECPFYKAVTFVYIIFIEQIQVLHLAHTTQQPTEELNQSI